MSNRWPDKFVVGLTGNIATGKSAVMDLAASRGALVIDADKIVHQLFAYDAEVQDLVEATFGSAVRRDDDTIDREKLGALVFNNRWKMSILESIVHPVVRQVLINTIDQSETPIIFIEAIKLLESSLARECDQIWVTRCPRDVQITRLMTYRDMDEEAATRRVDAQPPQDEKVAAADVVIDTIGTLKDTANQFDKAWAELLKTLPAPIVAHHRKHAASGWKEADAPLSEPDIGAIDIEQSSDVILESGPQARASSNPQTGQLKELAQAESLLIDTSGVRVRRARPSDVPELLWLIRRSSKGAVRTKRKELLLSLGERGYLIGERRGQISALFGWSSENLIATIDMIIVNPPDEAFRTGAAVLQEIENTANGLICEVILAFPPKDVPDEVNRLFINWGFVDIEPENLPGAWRSAVDESRPEGTKLLMKILRQTRAV